MTEPLKITVPANFGVKNLDSPFHNNISLQLKSGEPYRANSIILSYNSPVFERLFLELNQSALEMDDFSPDIVRSFIRALYAGRLEVNQMIFREVNKLSKVFEVKWVKSRCADFWAGLLNKVNSKSSFYFLKFILEEAEYAKISLNETSFIESFTALMWTQENRSEMFVKPFLNEYSSLTNFQVDLALEITRPDPTCILKIMKTNIQKQGCVFDRTSRYFLQNLDLCLCIEKDKQGFEDLFDFLAEIQDIAASDLRMINNQYRAARKGYDQSQKSPNPSTSQHVPSSSTSAQEPPAEVPKLQTDSTKTMNDQAIREGHEQKSINSGQHSSETSTSRALQVNREPTSETEHRSSESGEIKLYNIFAPAYEFGGKNVDDLLEYISTEQPSSIRNLYDLIDALYLVSRRAGLQNIKDIQVKKINEIRQSRNWKRVNRGYLDSWVACKPMAEKLLTLYDSDLVFMDNSKSSKVIGRWGKGYRSSWITCKQLSTAGVTFKFELIRKGKSNKTFLLKIKSEFPWHADGNFAIYMISNEGSAALSRPQPEAIHLAVEFEDGTGQATALLSWSETASGVIRKAANDGFIQIGELW